MAENIDLPQDDVQPSTEFVTGFNHAYILAVHEPSLLEQITPKENPNNEYFDGFFAGKEEWHREQQQKDQLNELQAIRNNSIDHSRDLEH